MAVNQIEPNRDLKLFQTRLQELEVGEPREHNF